MWQQHGTHDPELVATVDAVQGIRMPCFNSGLMLLTPSASSSSKLELAQSKRVWDWQPRVLCVHVRMHTLDSIHSN